MRVAVLLQVMEAGVATEETFLLGGNFMSMNMTKLSSIIVALFALVVMAAPSLAQTADLEGRYFLSQVGKKERYLISLKPMGNSWLGQGVKAKGLTLKLNPAGLRGEWVGFLKTIDKIDVKMEIINGRELHLKELDGKRTWTLEPVKGR